MTHDEKSLKTLIDRIRRCFWRLGAVADASLADLGLSASLRAIMEHLHEHGPATVPQIAAAKSVRRQSIQELVDRLGDHGLVTLASNPAHRRSPLVALSKKGRLLFAQVRARDARLLRRLLELIPRQNMTSAIALLTDLQEALGKLEKEMCDAQ